MSMSLTGRGCNNCSPDSGVIPGIPLYTFFISQKKRQIEAGFLEGKLHFTTLYILKVQFTFLFIFVWYFQFILIEYELDDSFARCKDKFQMLWLVA